MKLNMGCGHNKMQGWINVDMFPECTPDVVCDLEVVPWPWRDDSVDAVRFNHSLEHMGQLTGTFLGIMKELYRVCRDRAEIEINVPHPRHDNFICDPTHVRIITPRLLSVFNRDQCDTWKRQGSPNSPLAHYLHVDFEIVRWQMVLGEPYSVQMSKGLLSEADLDRVSTDLNNVGTEYRIVIVAKKGARAGAG